jgi:hypothetical protein
MCTPSCGELLCPVFAGAAPSVIEEAFALSTFSCTMLDCGLLAIDEVLAAVRPALDKTLPGWSLCEGVVDGLADMGGHMRSVEQFVVLLCQQVGPVAGQQVLTERVNDVLPLVIQQVRRQLDIKYGLPECAIQEELLRNVLLAEPVTPSTRIAGAGPTYTSLVPSGLLSITAADRVEMPYIQCVRYAEALLPTSCNWIALARKVLGSRVHNRSSWQDWEQFCVDFHALRLTLFACNSDSVTGEQLFRGACASPDVANLVFPLIRGHVYGRQEINVQYCGDDRTVLSTQFGNVKFRDGACVIRNGAAAEWADWFVWFAPNATHPTGAFAGAFGGQCKMTTTRPISSELYSAEARKVQDRLPGTVFGLFANWRTQDAIALGAGQVLVSADQFADYFGHALSYRAHKLFGTAQLIQRAHN